MLPLKKFFVPFISAVLIIAITSCEYQTDEVYFKNLPKPDWSGVSVELSGSEDTLYLSTNTTLTFDALIGNHKVKGAFAKLGDQLVHTSGDGIYPITILMDNFASGTYKLELELRLSAGNGSFAELRGQDIPTSFFYDWIVVIDHEAPEKIHITSIGENNGSLEIKWTSYEKFNFQYYTLSKYCYNEFYHYFEHCWTKVFNDAETLSLTDSSFIGGRASYRLQVAAANKFSETDEQEIEYKYDAGLQYKWINSTTMELAWRKPPFVKNVASYKVFFGASNDERTFFNFDANDTTVEIPSAMKFPETKVLRVAATPVHLNDYNLGDLYGSEYGVVGNSFPFFSGSSLVFSKALQKYFAIGYFQNEQSLIQIDPVSLQVEQAYPSSKRKFAISENGEHLYVLNDWKLLKLNPADFTVIESFDFALDYGGNAVMSVTNNNRLFLGVGVWDMNSFTQLPSLPSNTVAVRPDGEFVVGYLGLYHFNGTTYQLETQLGSTAGDGEFTSDGKFLNYSLNKIRLFDLGSMSLEKTIAAPGASYLRLDPVSGMVGGFTDEFTSGPKTFYVFSISGTDATKEIEVANVSSESSHLLLVNNNLICSCANYVPISWYE